jgi:pyruvate/2-oxoacid:ferredoxin oxidoreductase alpha subunit
MHEMLFQASGLRLPIVMVNVNRAVGAPWTIYTDQSDSMAQRDTGWIQFYCENVQEVLDMIIQSYRIAEKISLPIMVISEGFVLSHTTEPVEIPEQGRVDEFLPPYQPKWKLDTNNPMAFGGHASSIQYAELRKSIEKAMEEVGDVQPEAAEEFCQFFGRKYLPIEFEGRPDPEVLVVSSGTISGTVREVLKNHPDVSLMKIRMFRPFPYDLVRKLSWRSEKIVVLDRNISFGSGGIFAESIRSSLYNSAHRPPIFEFIVGIGGTDVTPKTVSDILDYVLGHNFPASRPIWQSDLIRLSDRRD